MSPKIEKLLVQTLIAAVASLVAGCISVPAAEKDATVRRGNAPASIVDLQAATSALKIYDATPDGAEVLTTVTAIRCHANLLEPEPTEATTRADLLISAFGKGANAISEITVVRQPGNLGYGCYFRYFGTAQALKVLTPIADFR